MLPVFAATGFDLRTVHACLQYVVDSLDWLVSGDGMVLRELDITEVIGISTKLEAALSRARTLRNYRASINKLPPETLSQVFEQLQCRFVPVGGRPKFDMRWLGVNSVCRHWRWVATSTPTLWTQLNIRGHLPTDGGTFRRLSQSFIRSGLAPLTIFNSHWLSLPGVDLPLFSDIITNISRIKDFRVFEAEEDLLRRLSSGAPALTVLVVECHECHESDGPPLVLFGGWKTPQLRTIMMARCSAWETITLQHLRHLILTRMDFSLASATALLNILSSNPRLEDLILDTVSSVEEQLPQLQAFGRGLQPLTLLKIARIFIKSDCPTLLQLISMALAPNADTECAIRYRFTADASIEFWPSSRLFSPCKKLEISGNGLIGVDGRHVFCFRRLTETPSIESLLELPNCAARVEELWVRHWKYRLTSSPGMYMMINVVKLVILDDHDGGLAASWVWESHDLFPALRELWIVSDRDLSDHFEVFDAVLQFLRDRNDTGRRLHTLRFTKACKPTDHGPPMQYGEGSDDWQESFASLALFVDHVRVDILDVRPRMELPPIWTEPSAVHDMWPTWRL